MWRLWAKVLFLIKMSTGLFFFALETCSGSCVTCRAPLDVGTGHLTALVNFPSPCCSHAGASLLLPHATRSASLSPLQGTNLFVLSLQLGNALIVTDYLKYLKQQPLPQPFTVPLDCFTFIRLSSDISLGVCCVFIICLLYLNVIFRRTGALLFHIAIRIHGS